jgi:polyhydroxyalkanoate synthesis regulator phasin
MGILEEMLKQSLYTGLGLTLKAGDLLATLVENAVTVTRTSQDEGRRFFERLMQRSAEEHANFSRAQTEDLKEKLTELNVATQDDILRLKAQVTKLELLLKEKGVISDIPVAPSAGT